MLQAAFNTWVSTESAKPTPTGQFSVGVNTKLLELLVPGDRAMGPAMSFVPIGIARSELHRFPACRIV
jgi:hypothetical protein